MPASWQMHEWTVLRIDADWNEPGGSLFFVAKRLQID